MKKFWEKHDLFKVAGIMVLLAVLLTWIIPQGYWSGSELTIGEITRVGIFDFFTYGLLGMYYFTVLVTFLFVLGGFYQVLSKTGGYQKLTESIAKKFKGKEILFVILVSFKIAALTAIMNEYFVVIAFIPFIISIMSKMKLDKLTGFVTTFGALIIGIIGTVYNAKIVGVSVAKLGFEYPDYLWVRLVLFGVAFIVFTVFNILHVKKTLASKKNNEINEVFVSEEVTKKNKVWPLVLILSIFAIVSILAYFPWETFGIEFFANITTKITEFKIFGTPVFGYLLGTGGAEKLAEFGKWDIFGIQVLMFIAAIIIKMIYKVSKDEFFTSFGEGFKKSGKLVVLLLMAYFILEIAVMFPVLPTIVDWFMNLSSKFNVVLGTISSFIASLFTTEYQYTVSLVGSYMTTTFSDFSKQITIMLQATYGLASLVAPSSAILLIGLSYLGISYKEWIKYIWKFLIIMLAVVISLLLIIC